MSSKAGQYQKVREIENQQKKVRVQGEGSTVLPGLDTMRKTCERKRENKVEF